MPRSGPAPGRSSCGCVRRSGGDSRKGLLPCGLPAAAFAAAARFARALILPDSYSLVHGILQQRATITPVARVIGPVVGGHMNLDVLLLAQLDQGHPLANLAAAAAGLPQPQLVGSKPSMFKISEQSAEAFPGLPAVSAGRDRLVPVRRAQASRRGRPRPADSRCAALRCCVAGRSGPAMTRKYSRPVVVLPSVLTGTMVRIRKPGLV